MDDREKSELTTIANGELTAGEHTVEGELIKGDDTLGEMVARIIDREKEKGGPVREHEGAERINDSIFRTVSISLEYDTPHLKHQETDTENVSREVRGKRLANFFFHASCGPLADKPHMQCGYWREDGHCDVYDYKMTIMDERRFSIDLTKTDGHANIIEDECTFSQEFSLDEDNVIQADAITAVLLDMVERGRGAVTSYQFSEGLRTHVEELEDLERTKERMYDFIKSVRDLS